MDPSSRQSKPFKGPEKPWESMAKRLGGEFVVPSGFKGLPHLKIPFRQSHIEVFRHYDTETLDEFTAFSIPVTFNRDLTVAAYRNLPGQKMLSMASKLFKVSSTAVPGLDRSIEISNSSEDLNALIFGDEKIQHYLNTCDSYVLMLMGDTIRLYMPGVKTDVQTVELGIQCVEQVAAHLEDNGLISAQASHRKSPNRGGKLFAWIASVSACLLIVLGLGITFGPAYFLRKLEPYQGALQKARNNAAVVEVIGEPVKDAWFGQTANFDSNKYTGSFNISGPKGAGTMAVDAEKVEGKWEYRELSFKSENEEIEVDITPLQPMSLN